jgi:hypothetical protein
MSKNNQNNAKPSVNKQNQKIDLSTQRSNQKKQKVIMRKKGGEVTLPGVVGIINPFDPTAEGLKLPDATAYPSLPFHVKSYFAFSTSATTGAFAASLLPFGSYAFEVPASVTAGGAMTWALADTASTVTNWSSYVSAMQLYRTVVGGVKVIITSALLSTQGKLVVCHTPIDNIISQGGNTYFPTNLSQMINMPYSEEYALSELTEEELIIPFRRYSDVSEHYRDVIFPQPATLSSISEENACGWCAITICLVGAQLTAPVSVDLEHIIICEGLELGTDTILVTTPAASFDPAAMSAIYQVNQAMPVANVTKDPEQGSWVDSAMRKTKNTFKTAAKVGGFLSEMAALSVML